MIDYDAKQMFALAAELGLWQASANIGAANGIPLSDDGRARIPAILSALRDAAERDGMEALAADIANRLATIEADLSHPGVGQQLQEISARFASDLGVECVRHLSGDERLLLTDDYPFGREAMEANPSIIEDAREAARSYAVSRYTATVFHSMRVCEELTRRLARRAKGVTVKPNQGMGVILSSIERELRAYEAAVHKGQKPKMRKAQFTFVSGAVAILRACKDGWRNASAHPGRMYTEGEARDVLALARQITGHLDRGTRR